ncbi:hypothetical protein ABVK25_011392 [Lepraria finkii]|uniref:Heterokaryon incompatibility domain-containing protein n=1 Tax=Lepraria finkii TaxID=1340010 RepID=A0ABR4APC6_9LECA
MEDIHRLRYGPLNNNQIRLFKLDLNEADAPLSGSIITFRVPCWDDFTLKNMAGQFLSSDVWHNTAFTARGDNAGYDVLSYVWGDADRIYPLTVSTTGKVYSKNRLGIDGNVMGHGTIRIRHNLYTLLHQLRRIKYDRCIWIDSICIDQDNQPEKGVQIPLMRHIYKEAKNVIVWLGEATQAEEGALTILPAISGKLKKNRVDDFELDPEQPESFDAIGLPEPAHPVWPAIGSIMTRPWFRRLWTLQEVVLQEKEKITVLCGGRRITWEAFADFGHTASNGYRQGIINWTITGNQLTEPAEPNGYAAIRMITDCRNLFQQSMKSVMGGCVPLRYLLLASRQREATNPADMIFGMLGMASYGLGKVLDLDISMSPIEVYVTFAGHYLRNEVSECLLNHVASRDRLPGLPSWCPNFGSPEQNCSLGSLWWDDTLMKETPHSRRYYASHEQGVGLPTHQYILRPIRNTLHRRAFDYGINDTPDPRQLSLLPNPHKIHAAGVTIDVITQIVPYNSGIHTFATSVDAIRQTLEWETLCRSLAIHTLGASDDTVPEAYWRTLIANQTYGIIGEERVLWDTCEKIDMLPYYYKWIDYMNDSVQQNQPLFFRGGPEWSAFWFCLQTLRILKQRCFFATRDGRLGIGPRTMEVGDKVVVLFYCPTPYILRRKEADYQFVGETYVHGLMYNEGIDMLKRGELDEQVYVLG